MFNQLKLGDERVHRIKSNLHLVLDFLINRTSRRNLKVIILVQGVLSRQLNVRVTLISLQTKSIWLMEQVSLATLAIFLLCTSFTRFRYRL